MDNCVHPLRHASRLDKIAKIVDGAHLAAPGKVRRALPVLDDSADVVALRRRKVGDLSAEVACRSRDGDAQGD